MKVGIFGMGAYGMALSSALLKNNCDITMWSKFTEEKELLEKTRKNEKLLPGFKLSEDVKLTTSVEDCAKDKDILIIAIPIAFVDSLCKELNKYVENQYIVIASKGIEQETNLFAHEIIRNSIDTEKIAIISGPSFAIDLIQGMPQALTVASSNASTLAIVKKSFESETLRIEISDDIYGVEICGSVKNIVAIATGILEGLKVNESTRAMFMVEAINNIRKLLKDFNCNEMTILTFSGIGDLLLTCTSEKSRNFRYGILLGENKNKTEIKDYIKNTTVEGFYTLVSLHEILIKNKIENYFFDLIYNIAINGMKAHELLNYLKN